MTPEKDPTAPLNGEEMVAQPVGEEDHIQETPQAREDETQQATPNEPPEGSEEPAPEELALEEKMALLAQQLAAQQDTLLRTAAEYDNFRKRSAKEKDAAFSNGMSYAVSALLPIIDTLEMAVATPTEDVNFKKGVQLTLDKCADVFKTLGAEEIPALGLPFDPELHAAVAQSEDGEAGTVTAVMQKGYTLGGKVLRHTAVVVAIG
ncbi:nucleotide exchange factor GrpE [Ruminococcaceae bacterium OttesenSCG-928-N02]|nr:nucleotide exchange factor GrpE [Ruminococcaceae bacterium OttesenSCG-928-N02]